MNKNRPQVYQQWLRMIIKQMPHLSKPQAKVLGMWSFGIAMTNHCGLSTVAVFLAQILHKPENTLRERLRQWYFEGGEKQGRKRGQINVEESFLPLLSWVLSWWSAEEKSLVLAADATTLGQRFTALVISVVYRGCGIPVAWKIIPATEKGSWKPHWLKLLEQLKDGIPDEWWVMVATDRGLYAKWFYQAIEQKGWHPFMRINTQGFYQPESQGEFLPLNQLLTEVGHSWTGKVSCFKSQSLPCTLLARWDEAYSEPWLIVTDLTPEQGQICWYRMRSWIECLFKDLKRGGFGWHHTKMTDPTRAERLWLAIAVATLYLISLGGQATHSLSASGLPTKAEINLATAVKPDAPPQSQQTPLSDSATFSLFEHKSPRLLSCFRRGFLVLLASVVQGMPLPTGCFIPDFSPAPG